MAKDDHKINGNPPSSVNPIEIQEPLRVFHVYHALNKHYMFTEHLFQPRKYVGWVLAKDLDDAWQKAQNDFNPAYRAFNVRSTSTGDMFQNEEGFYLIKNLGFEYVCDLEGKEFKPETESEKSSGE